MSSAAITRYAPLVGGMEPVSLGIVGTAWHLQKILPVVKDLGLFVPAVSIPASWPWAQRHRWSLIRAQDRERRLVAHKGLVHDAKDAMCLKHLLWHDETDVLVMHRPPQFTLKDAVVEGCFIGKHVICPPAMGLDYSEALAMRDAARPHAHALGHTANELRYSRKAMWAREHVASGGLGAVENVEVRVHGAVGLRFGQKHTWWHDRRLGGGVLNAVGAHALDLAEFIAGMEVNRVCCERMAPRVAELVDGAGQLHVCDTDDVCDIKFEMTPHGNDSDNDGDGGSEGATVTTTYDNDKKGVWSFDSGSDMDGRTRVTGRVELNGLVDTSQGRDQALQDLSPTQPTAMGVTASSGGGSPQGGGIEGSQQHGPPRIEVTVEGADSVMTFDMWHDDDDSPDAITFRSNRAGEQEEVSDPTTVSTSKMSPWTRGAAMMYRGLNEFWINHGDHANHITNYGAPLSEELWDYSLYLAPLVKFDDAVRMRAVLDAVLLSHDRQQRNGTDGTDGSEWVDVEEITGRVGERDAATGGEGEGEDGLLDPFIHGRAEPQFVVRTDGSRKSNE